MKKIIFLLFINLIFANQITAQEADDKKSRQLKHEVGINATAFIKQILSLSDTSSAFNISPYLITYKLMTKHAVGLRTGLGIKYNRKNETFENNDDSLPIINSSFDWRVGIEWQKTIGKRLTTSVGADFIHNLSFKNEVISSSSTEIITFEQKTFAIGGGPVLGLTFNINDKISLYTETAAYFSKGNRSGSVVFKNKSQSNNQVDDTTIISLIFYAPASIYFVFKF